MPLAESQLKRGLRVVCSACAALPGLYETDGGSDTLSGTVVAFGSLPRGHAFVALDGDVDAACISDHPDGTTDTWDAPIDFEFLVNVTAIPYAALNFEPDGGAE